ncbi:hypothetical protein GW17_00062260 [Ensete ventricosum]|nr:hypothetical protein GW17_00062260 [Ensete ventricosum]
MKDKGRSPTSHAKAYSPIYCHPSPHTKKLTRDELHERSTKGLYRHYDEPWSREHHCKKGRHLVIEPMEDEDNEPSEEVVESKEEAIEEESQPADYAVHALTDYSNDRTPVGLKPLSRRLFLLRQVGYRRGKGLILLRKKLKCDNRTHLRQSSHLRDINRSD